MKPIFDAVFGWLTTDGRVAWQKIAAFMIVATFCLFFGLFGYIVYDQRSYITAQISTTISKVEFEINARAAPGILKDLMRDTGALAAMTWEFDWETNQRRLVYAANRDGKEMLKGLDLLSILRPNSQNNSAVVNTLFNAQHACLNIDNDAAADIKMVKASIPEVVVYCISGVRTLYGGVRGAVTLFLPKSNQDQAIVGAKLRNAADKILTRP